MPKQFHEKATITDKTKLDDDKSAEGEPKELTADAISKGKAAINMSLHRIKRGRVDLRVGGASLIVNAWSDVKLDELLRGQQMTDEEKRLAKKNRKKKDPKADFEGAKYIVEGKDCFPTNGFKKAMVDAGYMLGIPKTVIRAAIRFVGDMAVIEYTRCAMRQDAVTVGKFPNRTADVRFRPEYIDWKTTLKIEFRTDLFNPEQVAALVENAGFSIGVGEWRPQRDGQHGTFEVLDSVDNKLQPKAA